MQKLPLNSPGLLNTFVKAETTKFFGFATKITDIQIVVEIADANHRFIASMR
jgi:hypothetical protein